MTPYDNHKTPHRRPGQMCLCLRSRVVEPIV
jgi:hypothetical protein